MKKTITRKFVSFILFFQISAWNVLMTGIIFFMRDMRILVLILTLSALVYVFSLSRFSVCRIIDVFYIFNVSDVGFVRLEHSGSMVKEMLHIVVYAATAMFVVYRASLIRKQNIEIKESKSTLKKTYKELEEFHGQVEEYNNRLVESLRYAELIQRPLLPGIDRLKSITPDSFFLWIPKDIVGGDIFYSYTLDDKAIVALIDCTGHGVPVLS